MICYPTFNILTQSLSHKSPYILPRESLSKRENTKYRHLNVNIKTLKMSEKKKSCPTWCGS